MTRTDLAPPLSIIVLAAGKGRRMRSALPKVLHAVGGVPMLGRVLGCADQVGADRIVCVIGHGAQAVQRYAESLPLRAGPVAFVVQDPPQGTGDAVARGLTALSDEGQTLVLYGDVPLIRAETLSRLLACAAEQDGIALLTARPADPRGYGRILRDASGAVLGSVEEKDATPEQRSIREVNTGVLTAPTALLRPWVARLNNQNAQAEYYLTDVLAMAVGDGYRIASLCCEDHSEMQGVNSQGDRSLVERQLQARLAQELLEAGVTLTDPSRIDIRGRLTCGQDVQIDHSCVFEGTVELGDQVQVGPNCLLRNVKVAARARIEAMSHLEACELGVGAVVGPFARIRPGTQLGEGAHVGNFTEVKNSTIGAMSKANHLSYIGDATVGERVNIGAGTITCNYDGANKHRTIIEDDAFIGSDTQLVAPVVVGEGATLGAGTTLTADAPAGQLTLSRVRQTSLSRWKRPKKSPQ